MNKRNKLNYFFFVFYFILYIFVPTFLILWGTTFEEVLPDWISEISGAMRLILFFLVLPIFYVYVIEGMKIYFPINNKKVFYFFIPYILSFLIYFFGIGFDEGFFTTLMLQNIPMFIGFMTCLFIGMIILMVEEMKLVGIKQWYKVPIALLLMTLIFFPVFYIFTVGLNINLGFAKHISDFGIIVIYILTILFVMGFHFKVLLKMYDEGRV